MLVPSYVSTFVVTIMVILFTDMIYLKITNSNKPNIMTIIILAISGIVNAFLYIIENEVMSKLLSFIIINIINGKNKNIILRSTFCKV